MKILLSCLCAVLVFAGGLASSRACKYCQQMMMADPESARLNAQVGGDGSFPLDSVTDKFQAPAPNANLAAAPPAASVATRAADLPTTVLRRPVPPPAARAKIAPVSALAAPGSAHWADAGLLGLAAAGGLFCWRTRQATVPRP